MEDNAEKSRKKVKSYYIITKNNSGVKKINVYQRYAFLNEMLPTL